MKIIEWHDFHICNVVTRCVYGIFSLEVKGHLGVISGFGQNNFKNFYFHNQAQ